MHCIQYRYLTLYILSIEVRFIICYTGNNEHKLSILSVRSAIKEHIAMKKLPTLTLSESVLNLMEKITGVKPKVSTTVNLESCLNAVKMLQSDEKAAFALLPFYTFEREPKSMKMRQELLEAGKIEAVIYTPSGLFESTSIPVSVVVIGDNNSDTVMVVNASKVFHQGSHVKAILTEDDIEKIVSACSTETDFSRRVSVSEIAEKSYSLSPPRYILPDLKNPVAFGTLVKSYRCSLQLSPEQRKALTSDVRTDWQFAQPKNIIDGEIDPDLPYLKECRGSYLNHRIENGNIVISKLGSPLKVAVAEFEETQTVIGVGRLYIFDIDTEKADPHKIKKFMSSPLGQTLLSNCNTSMYMKNLDIDRILKMWIPYDEVKV